MLSCWGGGCEKLCERRRKLEEISAFFYHVADCVRVSVDLRYRNTNMWYVDGAVAVLKLLLTLAGLLQRLLECWKCEPVKKVSGESLVLLDRLFSLQIRERKARAAKEWPFDMGFVSKLLGLMIAPVAARILAEVLNRLSF